MSLERSNITIPLHAEADLAPPSSLFGAFLAKLMQEKHIINSTLVLGQERETGREYVNRALKNSTAFSLQAELAVAEAAKKGPEEFVQAVTSIETKRALCREQIGTLIANLPAQITIELTSEMDLRDMPPEFMGQARILETAGVVFDPPLPGYTAGPQ